MADIINFKSNQDWEAYQLTFEEHMHIYLALLNRVREDMYGKGTGNWANLPGSCAERVIDITNAIMYTASDDFRKRHPDYKDEVDEMFIPRRSFKEQVMEAVKEALKEQND